MELQASRSEALNNKLACCWRSFSFSPQPQEWPLKPWTPRFLHPAEAPAAIFKKNAPKPRGAAPGDPPPAGWGVSFEGGKKWLENFPRPLLEVTKVFFAPRRLSKSAREAILRLLECARARSSLLACFWSGFWFQKCPPGGPRNPENQGFRVLFAKIEIFAF